MREEAANYPNLTVRYKKGAPPTLTLTGQDGPEDPISLGEMDIEDLRQLAALSLGAPSVPQASE